MSLFSLIVQTCLILHNMNMEDRMFDMVDRDDEVQEEPELSDIEEELPEEERREDLELLQAETRRQRADRLSDLQDESENLRLHEALVEHCYRKSKKRKRK